MVVVTSPAAAQTRDNNASVAGLPPAADWVQQLRRDVLPFWETPVALGDPVGNFPTFRCNDGSLTNPQAPCPEFLAAPDWIRSAVGRQYVRMISRQVYLYGVAYHLTGDPKYLGWARAGVRYILDNAVNKDTGDVISYWAGGKPVDRSGRSDQPGPRLFLGRAVLLLLPDPRSGPAAADAARRELYPAALFRSEAWVFTARR